MSLCHNTYATAASNLFGLSLCCFCFCINLEWKTEKCKTASNQVNLNQLFFFQFGDRSTIESNTYQNVDAIECVKCLEKRSIWLLARSEHNNRFTQDFTYRRLTIIPRDNCFSFPCLASSVKVFWNRCFYWLLNARHSHSLRIHHFRGLMVASKLFFNK